MGHTHRCQLAFKKKKKKSPSPESRVPETGSDPPIGSGRDSGRDKPHEPEGTSRHSNGYRNFSSKQSIKIHGANPFTILNISLENNAEVKG